MKKFYFNFFAFLFFLSAHLTGQSQQYTESFNTAPPLTAYPGVPSWMQTATVTLGGTSYQFINSGNGGWEYKTTGGLGNSANLYYNTAATSTVRIQRTDGRRFQFYGAWLKYTNYTTSPYAAPWLRVTYEGSTLADETFNDNTTTVLSKNVNVTGVTLYYSGLQTLSFDEITVGPANPFVAVVSTSTTLAPYSQTTATLGGSISDDGGAVVTDRGIVYATNDNPTIADTKISIGSGTGSFSTSVLGLTANTTYYLKAFATNSVGTSYGSLVSFTTLPPFVVAGTHSFNTTSWSTTGGQANPYTKTNIEGWDVTATATGGLAGVSRVTGVNAGEGTASVRTTSSTSSEILTSLGIKANNGSAFSLKSFIFRYATKATSTSYGTITVTGYKNGVPVSGAVESLTGISPVSVNTAYNTFTIPANNTNFKNVDEIRLTASNPVNSARLSYFDFDALTIEDASALLPLTLSSFKAIQTAEHVQISWSSSSEINVEKFVIERSQNGLDFVKVGEVQAKNSFSTNNYTWTDSNAGTGDNFYRLRMLDKNESAKYSTITKVIIAFKNETIKITPNPVLDKSMGILFNNVNPGIYDINVFDSRGSLIYMQKIELSGSSLFRKITLPSSMTQGSYTVNIKSAKTVYNTTVVIK